MLAACARDEQAILTPKSALELMLAAWQKQDWEALYALVLREEETPTLSGFESQMRETNVQLMTYESTSRHLAEPGRTARDPSCWTRPSTATRAATRRSCGSPCR